MIFQLIEDILKSFVNISQCYIWKKIFEYSINYWTESKMAHHTQTSVMTSIGNFPIGYLKIITSVLFLNRDLNMRK